MNLTIDLALNMLYQRQISSREQLLNEMLRVKLTLKKLADHSNIATDKEQLFQFMKKTTEEELGFFPADRDDFMGIFDALKGIDLIDFTLEIFKNDRLGTIIAPGYLTTYTIEKLQKANPRTLLITEAEKHLAGLKALIRHLLNSEITLTTQHKPMSLLLRLCFGEYQNVKIVFESIYTDYLKDEKFDYIYSLPTFGYKPDELERKFFTRDSEGIALENILGHLKDPGTLDIIVPAKITFASMGYEKLRAYITEHFNVSSIFMLPEGTFRPVTSIKTYLLSVTTQRQNTIEVGTMKLSKDKFELASREEISTRDFLSHEDWRIELLLADDDENIQKFKNSSLEKVKLKEVAEIFRGKSILKKDTALGSIGVLNISNIENGEIDYSGMETIEEEERKIKRYELISGDVVLACRGTALKSAVVRPQAKTMIASANLIVIRPKEKVLSEYLKIFLESPIGIALIKSFQRGTTIMNINHTDIMELEIPSLPMNEQQEMIDRYRDELSIYKATVSEAQTRWQATQNSLYNKFI
ncbi:MAG: restriction endonuclease subunit S [Desulfitobacteriaceae bacterium]